MRLDQLTQQALALSGPERFELMHQIQGSLMTENFQYQPSWLGDELNRRLQQDRQNPDQAVGLDDLLDRLTVQHGWDQPPS